MRKRQRKQDAGIQNKSPARRNAGTTMIEVLVAFLVVSIMVGMFSKVITASVHMQNESRKMVDKLEKFNEDYYKKEAVKAMTPAGSGDLILEIDRGAGRTGSENGAKDVELKLTKGVYQKYERDGIIRYTFNTLEP